MAVLDADFGGVAFSISDEESGVTGFAGYDTVFDFSSFAVAKPACDADYLLVIVFLEDVVAETSFAILKVLPSAAREFSHWDA